MNKLKKIVNKISSLKSVFTPADKYNELIDNHNELITVVEELSNNSGGGGTTDLFTDTTANQFVKTNSTNDGLQSVNLFADTASYQFLRTNSTNDGLQSLNLFNDTTANKAVKANSTNTGLEDLPISIDETNKKVLIGENFTNSGSITNQCVLISGDNIGNNAINGTDPKANIIGINAIGIKRGNITVIGNSNYRTFVSFGNNINVHGGVYLSESGTISSEYLGQFRIVNDSTNALTVTINGSVNNIVTYYGVITDIFNISFIVDNTRATTGNNLTLVFSDPSFSVNGTDSLVVSSGNMAKFELCVSYDGNGKGYAKVCRVY